MKQALTAIEAFDTFLLVTAQYAARIHDIAMTLDLARHQDDVAAAAWEDRMSARHRSIRALLERLAAEGRLREEWAVAQATEAVRALSTPRHYADLVIDRGWTFEEYERYLLTVTHRTAMWIGSISLVELNRISEVLANREVLP